MKHFSESDAKLAILTGKLKELGVNADELLAPPPLRSTLQGGVNAKMVKFTFVGPAGLIEGGSNQSFTLPVDYSALQSVQQMKDMLV